MPVFIANGDLYVFAHVPKCAGTTVEEHLAARFGAVGLIGTSSRFKVSLQHLTWREIVALFPEHWIAGSFAVVRHPVDRLVSEFNMRIAQSVPPFPREISIADFLDWVERRLPSAPDLLDNHIRPQVDFIGPRTRLFRLEDGLDAVIAHLDELFGTCSELPPLGHHDSRNPGTEAMFEVSSTLPQGVAERVAQLYEADFDAFGYDPDANRTVRLKILKPELARNWRRTVWRGRMHFSRSLNKNYGDD
jgi:hypothetical protein